MNYQNNQTSIEEIKIPLHVVTIERGAFHKCNKLRKVKLPNDSELLYIKEDAFICSSIKFINIPTNYIVFENSLNNCPNYHDNHSNIGIKF